MVLGRSKASGGAGMEQGEQRRSGRREASGGAGRGNIPAPKETVDRGERALFLAIAKKNLVLGAISIP